MLNQLITSGKATAQIKKISPEEEVAEREMKRELTPTPEEYAAPEVGPKLELLPEKTESGEDLYKSGRWTIKGIGSRKLTPYDKSLYHDISQYAQRNIPGMDRDYWMSIGGKGALGYESGMKHSPFETEEKAKEYIEFTPLLSNTQRNELVGIAKEVGYQNAANTQEVFHEIGHSIGLDEAGADAFSIKHTKVFWASKEAAPKLLPEELIPLAQQARQYKNAEEFIKAYTHGALRGAPKEMAEAQAQLQNIALGLGLNNASELVTKYYGDIDLLKKLPSGSKEAITHIDKSLINFYNQVLAHKKTLQSELQDIEQEIEMFSGIPLPKSARDFLYRMTEPVKGIPLMTYKN
jgi:hypothetical protein